MIRFLLPLLHLTSIKNSEKFDQDQSVYICDTVISSRDHLVGGPERTDTHTTDIGLGSSIPLLDLLDTKPPLLAMKKI